MSGHEKGNAGYPLALVSPSLPPGLCASSAVAQASLVPGPCPHVFLKLEDLTASVSLRAGAEFPGKSGAERERGQEREMGHMERQQGRETMRGSHNSLKHHITQNNSADLLPKLQHQ